jgi:exodeoxyribonuclease VIII
MTEPKIGIFSDISNEQYHQGIGGLSASGLKLLAQSPKHFRYASHEETPAMRRGTATHCAVFEPDRFAAEYVAAPPIDKRTKDGKAQWAELESSGKIVLSEGDYADVAGMAEAVRAHSLAGALVSGGTAEQSVFWEHGVTVDGEEETILMKCRPDYIKPLSDGYVVVDLKTTTDARRFDRAVMDFGYGIQAAHYMRGMNTTALGAPGGFIFVVVESANPYGVMIYEVDQALIDWGYEETNRLYALYARCERTNIWPGYTEVLRKLTLPRWAA